MGAEAVGSDGAWGMSTLAIMAGEPEPRISGAAVMPIFQSATFVFAGEATYDSVKYTRCNNNPSQEVVAAKLAALEGAEGAVVFSSGMAAIMTTLLTLLKAGDHMLIQAAAYGGTYDLVHKELADLGITATKVDTSQPPHTWEQHLKENTKVVYVEAISNPTIQVPDLPAVAAWAQQQGLSSMIDATFATPVNLRPLSLGFDVVVHSATKYLNGHSDLIAGVMLGRRELVTRVRSKSNHLGGSLDPHAAFLLYRGLKTLTLRVRQQNQNATALAEFLEQQPGVLQVHYPGLLSHPQHQQLSKVFKGFGGVFAFELEGGVEVADAFMQGLQLALVAPSLGGVETLITRPATTTHVGMTQQQREATGIGEGLIRVAVGVEDAEDLLRDFAQALKACVKGKGEAGGVQQ